VGVSEVSGRMTDSWSPSSSSRREAVVAFPHVNVDAVIYQFRDYYQDPAHNVVLTRSGWDRKFKAWCSRREEAWHASRLTSREDQKEGRRFDEVTGMPVNPKPIDYAPREGS